MDLNKRLKKLKPQQLNCNVFDVYSYNGLTMQDLLCQFFTTINECVASSNEVLDLTEWLLNTGLNQEVVKELMCLIEDGTVESLINENLFDSLNTKIVNLNTQKANKFDLETQITRIDNFTKLGEGSTTGDAELIDGRIGFDGVTYNNLGSAIRSQIKNIDQSKVSVDDLFAQNFLNPSDVLIDKYVEYGVEKSYSGWNCIKYLKINNNNKYSLFTLLNGVKKYAPNVYISQYNKNKEYISDSDLRGSKLHEMEFNKKTEYISISATNEFISSNGVITLTKHEKHIKELIKYGEMINLKDIEISNISSDIKNIKNDYSSIYNNVVRSINRIGYDVYNSNTPPQQSIDSYKLAYDKGFRILLCDLRFTSDNIPVLWHDSTINTYAKNSDGSSISNTVTISNTTYNDLQKYDFGIYKGEKYKGTKIMSLKDMLKLCKNLGCELYVEVKSMTEEQCKIACDLVKQFRLEEKTSWCGTTPQMKNVIANIPTARVGTMPQTIHDSTIDGLNVLKTGKNKVFFFAWETTTLTKELIDKLISSEIEFEMGTLDTETDIINYFKKDDLYYYCTGISSNKLVAGKVILENEII